MPRLLLMVFGLGRLRPAPGTWGSLPPVLLALLLASTLAKVDHWMISATVALLGLTFAITCVRFSDRAEHDFGRKDPPEVVADEMAGQSIALVALPWSGVDDIAWNAAIGAVAFISFRFFDIVKPPPAHGVQRLAGGWGILADDLIAGAYALIVTQAVTRGVLPLLIG